ncbi:MAG TPA: phosphate ABC transporter permease subunit PstC [Anaerolineae bacterium]|nr:phosphate ABC transporter permease subunit PstC [Anaerolineae bacterium]
MRSLRQLKDRIAGRLFFSMTLLPFVLLAVMIVLLLVRARPLLETKPIGDLLFGEVWKPDQGEFGFWPFITGTVWVTTVAMIVAIPVCLLCSIYLSEYAGSRVRAIMKPMLDLLSGIPSVIFGVWGVIAVVPFVQDVVAPFASKFLSFVPIFNTRNNPTGYSIIAGGFVLGVMVTPVIIAVGYEVMQTVPHGLREASLSVGATKWQTIKHTVLPKALPGIIAGVVLGFSRAFGETMAVLMVVGNVPKVPGSIFDPAYPLTALIANNYGEMMSVPLYESALLGAALILLLVVVIFNVLSALALHRIVGRSIG